MPLSSLPRTAAAACALTLTAGAASAQVSYRTAALTGQPAPGTPAGTQFGILLRQTLSQAGTVAILGVTDGPGGVASGIWSEAPGPLSLVAFPGDPAPGLPPGTSLSSFSQPILSASGHIGFRARIDGPGFGNSSIWSGPADAPSLVVRASDPMPGYPPGSTFRFTGDDPLPINESGHIAFRATPQGPTPIDTSIWVGGPDSLRLVARAGAPAPGTPSGTIFDRVGGSSGEPLVINASGRTVFTARLTGPGVTFENDDGVWSDAGGELSLVARTGHPAPGSPPGSVFSSFLGPTINAAGDIAFLGHLTTPTGQIGGIWSGPADAPALIVRTGNPAPGLPAGTTFHGFQPAALTGAGQVAFLASLNTPTGSQDSVWIGDQNALTLVARTGDHAPGTSPATAFHNFESPAANALGQTAFQAYLSGPDVSDHNGTGIWATDPSGALTLIARTGDLFDVDDDPDVADLRTIVNLYYQFPLPWHPGSGGEDGRAVGLNDLGQLSFFARFTDGSFGVFVATIPAPGAAPLLPLAALIALRRRR